MTSPARFIDNPNWADFLPEDSTPARVRHLPTHEDCSPIDSELVAAYFAKGGALGQRDGYETRPGQIDMAKAVVRAFDAREHLMIEAGTGVGKSLAYLVPSILWAWTNDTPVIVSTATRNLQSQLMSSDIPRALAVLGDEAPNFKVALLKGRANYLCLRAVNDFFSSGYWTMSVDQQEEMPGFISWLQQTRDGDLDTYDGLPRDLISCPGEECAGRRCPFRSRCFIFRARKAAAEAHLVVANHALVLADAMSPGGGLLPNAGRLVFDEAHNLESVATDYFSREFSSVELARLLNRLERRRRGKRGGTGGVLAAVGRLFSSGAVSSSAAGFAAMKLLKSAESDIVRVVTSADGLFDICARMLRPAKDRGLVRYRVLGVRQHSRNGMFANYEDWDEAALKEAQAHFENTLAELVNDLHDLAAELSALSEDVPGARCGDFESQLMQLSQALVDFSNTANFVLSGASDAHTYWIEKMRPQRRPAYVRLVAAPLSVADDLKKMVWDVKDSAILASATLRVGNDFKYMSRRLGFSERAQFLTASSPFDYLAQCRILAADCLPDPSADAARYAECLASLMHELFSVTDGHALVLFTSYEMMRTVAEHVRAGLAADGIELLVQGEGASREAMTARLRESDRTVLFGAQSFWEGVDVAGEALNCVVIARLPFASRTDPIVEARCERIERDGGRWFAEYYLPEAVIRFRQGFGRLIRTQRDRGVVIITDPRYVTKNYGAIFRRSIPGTTSTVTDVDDLLARVREARSEFFGDL